MIAPVRWATKKAESTMLSVQISFLYVDLLDTTGTLVAMSKQAGLFDARDGDFEGSSVAFLVDSACISMSGLFFGSSPCTPFVGESSISGRPAPIQLADCNMSPRTQNPPVVSLRVERPG